MKFWQGFFSVFAGFDSYEIGRNYALAVLIILGIAAAAFAFYTVFVYEKPHEKDFRKSLEEMLNAEDGKM